MILWATSSCLLSVMMCQLSFSLALRCGLLLSNSCLVTFPPFTADKLGKQLRGIEGTALKVVGVQPISAASRQTCPFTPLPHPLAGGGSISGVASERLPRCMEPVEILVQLENSGVWGGEGMWECLDVKSI